MTRHVFAFDGKLTNATVEALTEPAHVTLRRDRLALQNEIGRLIAEFEDKHRSTVKEVVLSHGMMLDPTGRRCFDNDPVHVVQRTHFALVEVEPW